jgi:hypothetical protein
VRTDRTRPHRLFLQCSECPKLDRQFGLSKVLASRCRTGRDPGLQRARAFQRVGWADRESGVRSASQCVTCWSCLRRQRQRTNRLPYWRSFLRNANACRTLNVSIKERRRCPLLRRAPSSMHAIPMRCAPCSAVRTELRSKQLQRPREARSADYPQLANLSRLV